MTASLVRATGSATAGFCESSLVQVETSEDNMSEHKSPAGTVSGEFEVLLKGVRLKLEAARRPSAEEVQCILDRAFEHELTVDDAIALVLSGSEEWPSIVRVGEDVRKKAFGNSVQSYVPLYISSICVDDCSYCHFRKGNGALVARKRLSFAEFKQEIDFLCEQGITHVELVSATDPLFPFGLLVDFVRYARSLGCTVLINGPPFSLLQYRDLKEAGLTWVWLWMESFNRASYAQYHGDGPKADYGARLAAYERMGATGLNIGTAVLMGLSPDWECEVVSTIAHAQYLKKKYGVDITIGTPRLCPTTIGLGQKALYPNAMSDDKFMLSLALYRLCNRTAWINVTTRENRAMLEKMCRIGSVSNPLAVTIPGGYTLGVTGSQFLHESFSSVADFEQFVRSIGFEPKH